MKKNLLRWAYFALMLVAAGAMTACNDDNGDNVIVEDNGGNGGNEGDEGNEGNEGNEGENPAPEFRISVLEKTMNSVKVSVDETSGAATYYVSVDNKADFDERFATDEEYFAMKLDFIKVMAGVHNMTVAQYLEQELKTGVSEYEETDLYYDTEYYVCVFGLTAEGEVTTPLTKEAVRTETFQPSEVCQFVIQKVASTASSIQVVVGASDPKVRYYVDAMTEEDFNGFDSVNEAVSDIIFSAELFDDVDWSDPEATYAGRQTLTLGELEPGTTYAIIVFGINADGEQTTKAEVAKFATEAE